MRSSWIHGLRRAQTSPRGAQRPLWPITRQTANRQVAALMRTAGIEGPQACTPGPSPLVRRSRGHHRYPAPHHRRSARPSPAAARVRQSRSARRWCRLTFGAARASMRRFRGCTCTGCPPARCVRRSPRWWASRPPVGCRRTWSVGSSAAGTRRPAVVPAAARRRVGVPVGGRHLQCTSRRARAAVRAGGHRRERPRREALRGH